MSLLLLLAHERSSMVWEDERAAFRRELEKAHEEIKRLEHKNKVLVKAALSLEKVNRKNIKLSRKHSFAVDTGSNTQKRRKRAVPDVDNGSSSGKSTLPRQALADLPFKSVAPTRHSEPEALLSPDLLHAKQANFSRGSKRNADAMEHHTTEYLPPSLLATKQTNSDEQNFTLASSSHTHLDRKSSAATSNSYREAKGGSPMGRHRPSPQEISRCIKDSNFVITGVLPSLERQEAEQLIRKYGGRVTSAVSGKTSFLVAGDRLEDHRPMQQGSKYKKMVEINSKKQLLSAPQCEVLDETQLLSMVTKSRKRLCGGGDEMKAIEAKASKRDGQSKPMYHPPYQQAERSIEGQQHMEGQYTGGRQNGGYQQRYRHQPHGESPTKASGFSSPVTSSSSSSSSTSAFDRGRGSNHHGEQQEGAQRRQHHTEHKQGHTQRGTGRRRLSEPPSFKYTEVVRNKQQRENMPAHECQQCAKFYNALNEAAVGERSKMRQFCSRHRAHSSPQNTPEGYWNLDFPDSPGD
jgi:BRCT domain type II-containing protein